MYGVVIHSTKLQLVGKSIESCDPCSDNGSRDYGCVVWLRKTGSVVWLRNSSYHNSVNSIKWVGPQRLCTEVCSR
jgi:hypothetical protein